MRPILLTALCIALIGCSPPPKEDTKPKPLVDVKVAIAELTDVRLSVTASATIFPREQANIGPRLTGPIRSLGARKGDTVKAGQILAKLENRDLIALRQESEAAVADAQASLERVTAGTLPTDVARARGQLAVAESTLAQAQKFYDRRKTLFEQGAIPNRDLVVSETDLALAKTNHDVAKKSLDLLQTQSGVHDIKSAQSKLDQARARLASAQAQLAFADVFSPFGGTVTEQFLYPGDMARPDAPIFTVMDLSTAVARAQVPEAESPAIHAGQSCIFTPSDQPSKEFNGRVSMINQSVDQARRTVEIWCEIPNSSYALRGGVFGKVTFITGKLPKSVVIPQTAVLFNEGTRKGTVMVVTAKKTATKREVEVGEVFDGKAQVVKGLSGGETVIVEAGYGLPEGAEVRFGEEGKKDAAEEKK
jgi:multidrug efflux pump subunit AcrA (membrane-fusion protein)